MCAKEKQLLAAYFGTKLFLQSNGASRRDTNILGSNSICGRWDLGDSILLFIRVWLLLLCPLGLHGDGVPVQGRMNQDSLDFFTINMLIQKWRETLASRTLSKKKRKATDIGQKIDSFSPGPSLVNMVDLVAPVGLRFRFVFLFFEFGSFPFFQKPMFFYLAPDINFKI